MSSKFATVLWPGSGAVGGLLPVGVDKSEEMGSGGRMRGTRASADTGCLCLCLTTLGLFLFLPCL